MENDLLTPTFKTKRCVFFVSSFDDMLIRNTTRNVAAKVYAKELAALYAQVPKKAVAKL